MKKLVAIGLTLAMMVGMSSIAFASVTFDAETGTGYVSKGAVQDALELNNKGFQELVKEDVVFEYRTTQEYDVVIVKENQKNTVRHTREVIVNFGGTVEYNVKQNKQVVGFNLTGYVGTPTTVGTVPSEGDAWEGNFTVESVTLVGTTGGGLYLDGKLIQ